MAKISARGATEIARITAIGTSGTRYIYVMCSDGRVLYRSTGDAGTSYHLRGKIVYSAKRTRNTLLKIVTHDGLKES